MNELGSDVEQKLSTKTKSQAIKENGRKINLTSKS